MVLVRRARPWDLTSKVTNNFLLHHKFFVPLNRPMCRFYRCTSYPAYLAVARFICTVHRSYVDMLPIRPAIMTINNVELIHEQ